MLVRVLDGIRKEARESKYAGRYAVDKSEPEDVWTARARAYIHLYLKVMFGLRSFSEREHYVTDGGQDGGIDGYYIDSDNRIVYLIQSKFRRTESNFEQKTIDLSELLSMQIHRVLAGEQADDKGIDYNGKIKGMQRSLSEVHDIGRYSYKVIILANLSEVSNSDILRLTENTPFEITDYEKSYKDLLYPVISGTLFRAKGLGITLDLSNKSTGSKIGYSVLAEGIECEITVVYVPTLEIARVLSDYKNSVLTYNPRSYLEFEGEKVNNAIRDSIVLKTGNDFALLNNGLTIICDESGVNDRSGRKGKAQLFLLNPQIINGGQTAYTLSRIYDSLNDIDRDQLFEGKEVLVKAIAVPTDENDASYAARRIALIESISSATNSQTVVTIADRASGDPLNLKLQESLFGEFGILYERRRGEFAEGIRAGYVAANEVVGRTKFARVYLAVNKGISQAQKRRITVHDLGKDVGTDKSKIGRAVVGLDALDILAPGRQFVSHKSYFSVLAQIRATAIVSDSLTLPLRSKGAAAARIVTERWPDFLQYVAKQFPTRVSKLADFDGSNVRLVLNINKFGIVGDISRVIDKFFSTGDR